MSFNMAYSTLRWQLPDLEPALVALREAGWDSWEGRLPLDWLGPPSRLKQVCANAGMPMSVFTAVGSPDDREFRHVERNRRRMEFAAETGVECFMFMSGAKPEGKEADDDEIRRAAQGAEEWAEYAAELDLELSYHIHTNTLVDSVAQWQLYMDCLQKARLCIDVSHAQLWGYDPAASIRDFWSQLNYIHLQDYSSCTRSEDGRYHPVWCDVGVAENVDFPEVLKVLDDLGYDGVVTSCPGEPVPGADDPISEARRSAATRSYLRGLGY